MKKINLAITKCVNKQCKYRIISEVAMKECPICHGKLVKENGYVVDAIEEKEGFITLKKKARRNKNDNNKPRSPKREE
jgi:hypothetical protein